jgi:hypothetical protein
VINFKVRLKEPPGYNFGVWTSYLELYILNKKVCEWFMSAHPNITKKKKL